jgi:hypothetical protein
MNDFRNPRPVRDTDHIEPVGVERAARFAKPVPRGSRHLTLLSPVNCSQRSAKPLRHPRLDLNERNQASLGTIASYNEVQITMPAPKTTLENLPPTFCKPPLRYPLTPLSKNLSCRLHADILGGAFWNS